MNISFIGHHDIIVDDKLKTIIITLLKNLPKNEPLIFLCGGYGSFDNICAYYCNELKQIQKNIKVIFVTPYISENYQKKLKDIKSSNFYDEIIYPSLENVPKKYAISKRNEWIIENSDMIIAYVNNNLGGAYKSLMYAKRKNKKIVDIVKIYND